MSHRHPSAEILEKFMRAELSEDQVLTVVQHLATGCEACLLVTAPFWKIGLPGYDEWATQILEEKPASEAEYDAALDRVLRSISSP